MTQCLREEAAHAETMETRRQRMIAIAACSRRTLRGDGEGAYGQSCLGMEFKEFTMAEDSASKAP